MSYIGRLKGAISSLRKLGWVYLSKEGQTRLEEVEHLVHFALNEAKVDGVKSVTLPPERPLGLETLNIMEKICSEYYCLVNVHVGPNGWGGQILDAEGGVNVTGFRDPESAVQAVEKKWRLRRAPEGVTVP